MDTLRKVDKVGLYGILLCLDMKRFMVSININSPDELLLVERKALEGRIINYVIARQDVDEVRRQSMAKELSGLRHFFTHNDRTDINWTIIRGYLKEPIKAVKDRACTTAEIQKMLEHADLRTHVVILLMASSGMRVGATPSLKVKHLTPIHDKQESFLQG